MTRDYCTGFNSTRHNGCCQRHDNLYGRAGPILWPNVTRLEADRELRECVLGNGMSRAAAWTIFVGLRVVPYFWAVWAFWRVRHRILTKLGKDPS